MCMLVTVLEGQLLWIKIYSHMLDTHMHARTHMYALMHAHAPPDPLLLTTTRQVLQRRDLSSVRAAGRTVSVCFLNLQL